MTGSTHDISLLSARGRLVEFMHKIWRHRPDENLDATVDLGADHGVATVRIDDIRAVMGEGLDKEIEHAGVYGHMSSLEKDIWQLQRKIEGATRIAMELKDEVSVLAAENDRLKALIKLALDQADKPLLKTSLRDVKMILADALVSEQTIDAPDPDATNTNSQSDSRELPDGKYTRDVHVVVRVAVKGVPEGESVHPYVAKELSRIAEDDNNKFVNEVSYRERTEGNVSVAMAWSNSYADEAGVVRITDRSELWGYLHGKAGA